MIDTYHLIIIVSIKKKKIKKVKVVHTFTIGYVIFML